MSDRNKVIFAVVASLLLHLLIVLGLVIGQALLPNHPGLEDDFAAVAEPTPPPLELTVERLLAAASQPTPPVITSEGLKPSNEKPKDAQFQSDVDMTAASENPPTGDEPMPSQQGRNSDMISFEQKHHSPGQTATSASKPEPTPRPTPEPTPKPTPTAAPLPSATPLAKPTPPTAHPQPTLIQSETSTNIARLAPPNPEQVHDPLFKPTPVPSATPLLLASAPTPLPAPPKPRTSESSAPQPEVTQTEIQGSVSNHGPKAINALSTPLGRYQKAIRDSVGSRWNYFVEQRRDLITIGRTRISFFITASGAVEQTEIVGNTANDTFAQLCLQAVTEATIPPIPGDLSYLMTDGRMAMTFTFDYY